MTIHPYSIRLEASSYCQLQCPTCPTSQNPDRTSYGKGFLKLCDFKKTVAEIPCLLHMELSNSGEIFLNPELLNILEYAHNKSIILTANNGVNLNFVHKKVLKALVKYKFRSLVCSIDGASNETYKKYRKRGNFDRVIQNIEKINRYKRKYKSIFPVLGWQFIIFGHNEHEIPLAKKMAQRLTMHFLPKLSWDEQISPIHDKNYVKKKTGLDIVSRQEFYEIKGKDYRQANCYQIWIQPQINWDGKILGCCRNSWGDFGNAFSSTLLKSLNNKKIEYARKTLFGKMKAEGDIPCITCQIYERRKHHNNWLTPGAIRYSRFKRVWKLQFARWLALHPLESCW